MQNRQTKQRDFDKKGGNPIMWFDIGLNSKKWNSVYHADDHVDNISDTIIMMHALSLLLPPFAPALRALNLVCDRSRTFQFAPYFVALFQVSDY